MSNKEFKKFIEFKDCSFEEFRLAKEYYKEASPLEQRDFLLTCFLIVRQAIKLMFSQKSLELNSAKEVYEKHGLTQKDITYFLSLYKNKYMPKSEKDRYFKKQKEILYENVWQEAKLAKWEPKEISKLARKYKLTIRQINGIITYYFENILKLDSTSTIIYKRDYKKFCLYINETLPDIISFKSAYNFYSKFANVEEKEAFKNTSLKILSESQNHLANINEFLASLNLSLYNLYTLATIFKKDYVKTIMELFKPYYELFESNSWNAATLKEKIGKNYYKYREMAILYAQNILGITNIVELVTNKKYNEVRSQFKKAPIIDQILRSTNRDEYISLFQNNTIKKEDIVRFCYTYHYELPKEQKEAMEANLIRKYQEYLKQTHYIPNPKVYTDDVLEAYINSPLTLEEFCLANNLNVISFKSAIKYCKNKTLIATFKNKIATERANKKSQTELRIIELLNLIKNGLTINDTTYPFDLISFFILFPDINYKNIKTGFLPKEKGAIIRDFLFPLSKMHVLSKTSIYYMHIIKQITTKEGTYNKDFSKDELIEIISFMEKNNIPLTDYLFNEVCLKYATNSLDIYNQDTFSLK